MVLAGGLAAVVLWFGILPDLEEAQALNTPGEIVFPKARPEIGTSGGNHGVSLTGRNGNRVIALDEWIEEGFENVMRWERNPWRRQGKSPGSNFMTMLKSKDPVEVAKARDIQRRAEIWVKRLMERYPELAVTPHPVPDERNGFLKWVEFSERMKAATTIHTPTIGLGTAFGEYLNGKQPWDPAAASNWMKANAALMDEIRAMGQLTEASSDGISVDRYSFMPARLAKECADALMMEARLAAENGDAAAAMESLSAARGLGHHFTAIESPTLLHATMSILIQMEIERRVFAEILPALPPGSRDPAAWEAVVRPEVKPPAEFGRLMKGEWSVTLREWILPPMLDPGETKGPPDPGALLDAYSMPFAQLVASHENARLGDDIPLLFDEGPQTAGLSSASRKMLEMLFVGSRAWNKGTYRAASSHGLTLAAFSVMKDGTLPMDPVRGLPYRWDPATRTLSMPATPEFDEMKIKPVVVPVR